ncbi:MAG: DUF3343 domain-containing protein [Clostridium sp.]|uniref:DUF3343 domain-containing protein n=1 Tax=Clostridium culturomicium TaxID=1499683 RepID=UPI00058F1A84|nr:DUF3343 domain-containing protein [Clostridium culturomicium]MDU4891467.1 DUF3343 domain-containing protein [Clostridium sp.]MDU7085798.1 DUF3343 domain-containing protein [Clostridium sp.]
MKEFYIVTFNNTHEAMQAESLCLENNLKVTMMPTPTYITKSCGISLKIELRDLDMLKNMVNDNKMAYKATYELKDNKLMEVTFSND